MWINDADSLGGPWSYSKGQVLVSLLCIYEWIDWRWVIKVGREEPEVL